MARYRDIELIATTRINGTEKRRRFTPRFLLKASIRHKYHDAILELAKWAKPRWNDQSSGFFWLRDRAIVICESWGGHNWKLDRERADRQRTWNRNRAAASEAVGELISVCDRVPGNYVEEALLRGLLAAGFNLTQGSSEGIPKIKAVEMLTHAQRILKSPGYGATCSFGPLVYAEVPAKLPDAAPALGVVLADALSHWRVDAFKVGTSAHHYPRSPALSKDLPWVAIHKFAQTATDNKVSYKGFQTRVKDAASKAIWINLKR